MQVGDTVTLPTYADLLQRIADDGIDAFYDGDIADDIINTVRERQAPFLVHFADGIDLQ